VGEGYFWFRHHKDASTFIAFRDGDGPDARWFMCAVGHPVKDIEKHATLLGKVPNHVEGGGSIYQ